MAKRQTRKSISVNAGLYPRARDFATAHKIPLAQLAEQAIEAVLNGRLVLKPLFTKRERMLATDAETGVVRSRPRVIAGEHPELPRVPDRRLKPFCANCTEPTVLDPDDPRCATLQSLGRNGAMVTICHRCAELPASDPRYNFGGGAVRPGLGEGSRWCSSKGVGK